jgi:hypothetical protein
MDYMLIKHVTETSKLLYAFPGKYKLKSELSFSQDLIMNKTV